MIDPKKNSGTLRGWGSLLIWLLLVNATILAGFVATGLYLHRAYAKYQADVVQAEYMGTVVFAIISSHLTSAPSVNPPNDLDISVRKIGDFLDDGLSVEQSITLPSERIGSDWPLDVRIRGSGSQLSTEVVSRLASLTFAEEFFVELSLALARSPDAFRLIADLDRSIAIAFQTDAWSARQPLWLVYSTCLAAALVLIGISVLSVIWTSRKIRGLATAIRKANVDQIVPQTARLSEFRDVERALAEIVSANEDRDAERINQLAAMSHDLHTPFTRLRLHVESLQDDQVRKDMLRDLEEIDVMIDESMRFLKREDQREEVQVVDIVSLVQSACDDASDLGENVTYRNVLEQTEENAASQTPVRIWINARPFALRRAIMNVIRNAVRFGGKAEVRLEQVGSHVHIMVDDPGPGIPEEYWDTISLPFKRIEKSRSKGTGGTGLGLATAKSVLDAIDGDLRFGFTEDKWFRVTLEIAVANGPREAVT